MSVPFPTPTSWRAKLKVPAILLGLGLLAYGCNRGVDAWQDAAKRRRAAPHLEASNPLRRRLGLLPIDTKFKSPFYEDVNKAGAERVVYFGARPGNKTQMQRGVSKYLTLDDGSGDPLTEEDIISFVGPKTQESNELHSYYLRCEYSFERAKKEQGPWRIQLTDEYYDGKETTVNPIRTITLTRAQADSVLRSWRVLGQRDSLARVARSGK